MEFPFSLMKFSAQNKPFSEVLIGW
jgi:hypothetical protein